METDETYRKILVDSARKSLEHLANPEADVKTIAQQQEQIARLVLVDRGDLVTNPRPRVNPN